MGDPRLRGVAAALSAALLGFWAPASAQKESAKSDTPVRAAAGVVVQYQESRSRILYLEQKGGMVTPTAPPVPANVPEPVPSLVVDPKAQSAVAPARKASRKSTT